MAAPEASLHDRHCVACKPGTPTLPVDQAEALLGQIDGWAIDSGTKLVKTFRFRNWKEAMAFANQISEQAEAEGHHPDLQIGWGRVKVELTTHVAGGLTENDFILAARIDRIAPAA